MPGEKKRKGVVIPARLCKREKVDYPLEMLACLDAPLHFGTLSVRPPTLGVFMLWELASCDFYPHPETCSFGELGRAIWIACQRRRAVQAVELCVYGDNSRIIDRGAQEVLSAGGEALIDNLPRLRSYLHTLPWGGFRMIPEAGDALDPCPFLFEGERTGLLASMAAHLGVTWDQVLWEIPLTLLGLMAAGEARRNKVDGVGRPYDREDVKRKLAEARAAQEAAAAAQAAPASDKSDPSDKSDTFDKSDKAATQAQAEGAASPERG